MAPNMNVLLVADQGHTVSLVTADRVLAIDTIELSDITTQQTIAIDVPNFMDGRAFSMVKRLRAQGHQGDIIICGDYLLDQLDYYIRVGATGFTTDHHNAQSIIDNLQWASRVYQQ